LFPNKNIYVGNWKEDDMNGKGKLIKVTGGVYQGHFVKGEFEGNGKYFETDKSVYQGEWKNS